MEQETKEEGSDNNSAIDQEYDKKLGTKLALIEELRHDLEEEGITCPGVIVVGQQSAGKSSVLEQLTGIQFPRAQNTCTRVPTIVQLQVDSSIKCFSAKVSSNPKFPDNNSTKQCKSPSDVGNAIQEISDILVEEKTPIADKPIHIRYIRAKGAVMTLIDLPGITHHDAQNENFDIHKVTVDMVRKYIQNDDMIVLVVIPANDDFGNAEALSLVKKIDGAELRSIGVVTKCDMVPTGENQSDIIEKIRMSRESDTKLSLGYVAVRNRAPDEDGLSTIDLLKTEKKLFSTHPILKTLQSDEYGYDVLISKIVGLQSDRVATFIPGAKRTIRLKLNEIKKVYSSLGSAPDTKEDRRKIFMNIMRNIDYRLRNSIEARDIEDKNLNISARTREFALEFGEMIQEDLPNFLSEEYGKLLEPDIQETLGYSMSNFMSYPIFRRKIIQHFFAGNVQSACANLIEEIYTLMLNCMENLLVKSDAQNWTKLKVSISESFQTYMADQKAIVENHTDILIRSEESQTYTQNHYYMDTIRQIKDEAQSLYKSECMNEAGVSKRNSSQKVGISSSIEKKLGLPENFFSKYNENSGKSNEKQSLMDLQMSIHCYAKVLMKRLFDTIPILVRHLLVLHPYNCILSTISYSDDQLEILIAEAKEIQNKRLRCSRSIDRLTTSLKKLSGL
eukprot:g6192.t1